MLIAALAVSPAALFAVPALTTASAQAPALSHPNPVYASGTPRVYTPVPLPIPVRPVVITTQPTVPSR